MVIFLLCFKIKKKCGILKSKKIYKISISKGCYYSKKLLLNFFEYKNYDIPLKKLKYIDHIISCVKYAGVKAYNDDIDIKTLKNFGIDISLPILYFEKIDKFILDCIKISKNYVNFNAITDIKYKDQSDLFLYLDKQFCSLSLFTGIMNLNKYTISKFKIVKSQFMDCSIQIDKNVAKPKNIVNDNFMVYEYIHQNVTLKISQFEYFGNYYHIEIINKEDINHDVDIKIDFETDRDICVKKVSKGIFIKHILNNQSQYLLSNKSLKYLVEIDKFLIPKIRLAKNINIKAKSSCDFIIYYGNKQLDENALNKSIDNYKDYLKKLLNFAINSKDMKLNYLINSLLPRKVTKVNYNKINSISFKEVSTLFIKQKIDALDYYMWLKETYFGILATKYKIKILPLYDQNFEASIVLDGKKYLIDVKRSNDGAKYLILDDVKFHNINSVAVKHLSACDKLQIIT